MHYYTRQSGPRGNDMMRDLERASKEVATRLKDFFDGLDVRVERYEKTAENGAEDETATRTNGDFTPDWSITETDGVFEIVVELAGFTREEIAVTRDGDRTIRIAGEKGRGEGIGRTLQSNRTFGSFDIACDLPETTQIADDGISAKHVDGLLTITIEKSEPAAARTIVVE